MGMVINAFLPASLSPPPDCKAPPKPGLDFIHLSVPRPPVLSISCRQKRPPPPPLCLVNASRFDRVCSAGL